MLMVKPGMPYLDLLQQIKTKVMICILLVGYKKYIEVNSVLDEEVHPLHIIDNLFYLGGFSF